MRAMLPYGGCVSSLQPILRSLGLRLPPSSLGCRPTWRRSRRSLPPCARSPRRSAGRTAATACAVDPDAGAAGGRGCRTPGSAAGTGRPEAQTLHLPPAQRCGARQTAFYSTNVVLKFFKLLSASENLLCIQIP